MMNSKKFKTVDEYIAALSPEKGKLMKAIRKAIHMALPGAESVISYNMPAVKENGIVIFYAAYKEHIGIYPKPSGVKAFAKELARYDGSKGTIKLPLNEPMPLDLLTRIAVYRAEENKKAAPKKGGSQEKKRQGRKVPSRSGEITWQYAFASGWRRM
ncbi:MAG: hypothetical protein HC859_14280, partial [Bacteroidia bacterium]|nr:hypothetical protein [Bacteroidia bacterium]